MIFLKIKSSNFKFSFVTNDFCPFPLYDVNFYLFQNLILFLQRTTSNGRQPPGTMVIVINMNALKNCTVHRLTNLVENNSIKSNMGSR